MLGLGGGMLYSCVGIYSYFGTRGTGDCSWIVICLNIDGIL